MALPIALEWAGKGHQQITWAIASYTPGQIRAATALLTTSRAQPVYPPEGEPDTMKLVLTAALKRVARERKADPVSGGTLLQRHLGATPGGRYPHSNVWGEQS